MIAVCVGLNKFRVNFSPKLSLKLRLAAMNINRFSPLMKPDVLIEYYIYYITTKNEANNIIISSCILNKATPST
jgi:hypothetical protein